jgi:hypothetical protein
MELNFKVGDLVETICNMPIDTGNGDVVKRRNRSGNFHIVQTNQWVGYPSIVVAIDCGKNKNRIKVGSLGSDGRGTCYLPHRLRLWKEENRKGEFEPKEKA